MTRVYLSWGMGVESTAILVHWLLDPESRNFPLSQLTVITDPAIMPGVSARQNLANQSRH